MDPGLVSSLSGALAQSKRVEIIANNLANADTPAFKADNLIFEEALQGVQSQDNRADIPERSFTESELLTRAGDERRVVLYGSEYTDLRAGGFKQTSNPLDVAIEGNGFLEVASPQGVRLTRAGNLALDAQGRLVTRDGFLVLGAGTAGQDPNTRALTIGTNQINIDQEGNIYGAASQGSPNLGRLSLVTVENPTALKKVGGGLFESPPEAFAKAPDRGPASVSPVIADALGARKPAPANPLGSTKVAARVHQGMLEGSNVNPINEMTALIEAQRLFDQNTKLMQVHGDIQSRASEIGKF
jgi:flagellar basal-body rod protein FlgF